MSDHTPSEKFWFIYSITLWIITLSITILASFIYFDVYFSILIMLMAATFMACGATIYSLKRENINNSNPYNLIKVRDKVLPIKLIFFGSIVFFPINFILGMITLWEGSPNIIDGAYWLTNHGNLVREITMLEYIRLSMAEMRLMTGCLLTFIVAPVAHFGIRNKSYKKEK